MYLLGNVLILCPMIVADMFLSVSLLGVLNYEMNMQLKAIIALFSAVCLVLLNIGYYYTVNMLFINSYKRLQKYYPERWYQKRSTLKDSFERYLTTRPDGDYLLLQHQKYKRIKLCFWSPVIVLWLEIAWSAIILALSGILYAFGFLLWFIGLFAGYSTGNMSALDMAGGLMISGGISLGVWILGLVVGLVLMIALPIYGGVASKSESRMAKRYPQLYSAFVDYRNSIPRM